MFETEYNFYKQNEKEFLSKYFGKQIVIKDNKILGIYDTIEQAMTETLKNYELGTFMVHKVIDEVIHIY